MTELFTNVPVNVKQAITNLIDDWFKNYDIRNCINVINAILESTDNLEESDFIRFYFNLKMEQMQNANNND